ncbi:MAG: polyprenyl synthetase family protein [Bdellovibrionales bacterium]
MAAPNFFAAETDLIQRHLEALLREAFPPPRAELGKFWECMRYSLLSGGKRFRPVLSLLTAKALGRAVEKALPMAIAVELIHTYSLIHDDLPMLDNDDERRGQPTNHKIFGEAQALLAGDALLTLAFGVLARASSPHVGEAVAALSQAAGPQGMVGGQVLDIGDFSLNEDLVTEIHRRKTGDLIRVAVEGAAILLGAGPKDRESLLQYSNLLGFAFQLADDLQDHDPTKPERVSYIATAGVEATRARLREVSDQAVRQLANLGGAADGLRRMVHFNLERV